MIGYIIGLVAAIGLVWVYFHFKGNPGFWSLTRKHPVEAMRFFRSDADWTIYDGAVDDLPGGKAEWAGPFRVIDPASGTLVKVYGRDAALEASQSRFTKSLHP